MTKKKSSTKRKTSNKMIKSRRHVRTKHKAGKARKPRGGGGSW